MDTYKILELKHVYKSYKKKYILKDINISLEEGKIYGIIGKNGAGKTSLMKIIAGLSMPDEGKICIMGKCKIKELEYLRRNVGCIIETPALYQEMSAYENLRALCILYGIKKEERINEILNIIGLEGVGNKKVCHFSLGMRQRLGIGMALINNPKILILDEPINGLDPDGIVEVRELIKKINKENKVTVLISSHILSEIYQMVDNFILINHGEILEQLSREKLEQRCSKYILIQEGNPEIIKKVLREKLNTENFIQMENGSFRIYEYTNHILKVMKAFEGTDVNVNSICVACDSLEEYFFKRMGE